MRKNKVSNEERIEAAIACTEGRISKSEAARRLGVDPSTVREWVIRYEENGPLAFKSQERNNVCSEELKRQAVEEYLRGGKSQREISAKYGLRSAKQLRGWIKVYNSGKGFRHRVSGGSRMKQGRKTTQEERVAIVKDCLENGSNVGETAIKHNVSYQQLYTWMRKFKEHGESGLQDRRGKQTAVQDPLDEMEAMKIKIAKLEHELYMTKMERDLLKKLDELERRDAFRK